MLHFQLSSSHSVVASPPYILEYTLAPMVADILSSREVMVPPRHARDPAVLFLVLCQSLMVTRSL